MWVGGDRGLADSIRGCRPGLRGADQHQREDKKHRVAVVDNRYDFGKV